VLVFTQFADTVHFLTRELKVRNLAALAGVTGNSSDPTELAWRFSPESNGKRASIQPSDELRALIATDILSEGQNLQDAHIVVNYDLPWAIIRLIQRAGRVDRIGQKAEEILCYSFLPSDGVERIINLRSRVVQRLRENAEVVGADEAFFEDEASGFALFDLYNENSGILDGDGDAEVDLASQAYQIWKNATDQDPRLQKIIPDMPNVSYSTRAHTTASARPKACLCICGRRRAQTRSHGLIVKAEASHNRNSLSCKPPRATRTRQPCRVMSSIMRLLKRASRIWFKRNAPSAAGLAQIRRALSHLRAFEVLCRNNQRHAL
jgi:superfamily II DNA/RNA helicase